MMASKNTDSFGHIKALEKADYLREGTFKKSILKTINFKEVIFTQN